MDGQSTKERTERQKTARQMEMQRRKRMRQMAAIGRPGLPEAERLYLRGESALLRAQWSNRDGRPRHSVDILIAQVKARHGDQA